MSTNPDAEIRDTRPADTVNMRPAQASAYTGISGSKLSKLRMEQHRADGPPFIKAAGCIIYRKADLDRWLEDNRVQAAA